MQKIYNVFFFLLWFVVETFLFKNKLTQQYEMKERKNKITKERRKTEKKKIAPLLM